MTGKPKGAQADLTFGEAMERLESVVAQLEGNEDLGLEQALALYEQGLALAGDCQQRLDSAKLRLTEIAPVTPALDPEAAGGVER